MHWRNNDMSRQPEPSTFHPCNQNLNGQPAIRPLGDEALSPPSSMSLSSSATACPDTQKAVLTSEVQATVLQEHFHKNGAYHAEEPQPWWQTSDSAKEHPGIVPAVSATQEAEAIAGVLSTTVTTSTSASTAALLQPFSSPCRRSRARTHSCASAPCYSRRPRYNCGEPSAAFVPDADKLWQHLREGANTVLNNLSHWISTNIVNADDENTIDVYHENKGHSYTYSHRISGVSRKPIKLPRSVTTLPLPSKPTRSHLATSTPLQKRRTTGLASQHCATGHQKKTPTAASVTTSVRLPSPPTPEELLHPSRSSLCAQVFRCSYWREPPVAPRPPLKLPEPTVWQHFWHLYDSNTRKVRLQRLRTQLYGDEPDSRQVFNHPDLCSPAALTWRHAWKSHVELTFFNIENVPHIAQVVVETNGFRVDVPFNVQFLRIPIVEYPGADGTQNPQLISVWFNSAYPCPYDRSYSKILFSKRLDELDDEDPFEAENFSLDDNDAFTLHSAATEKNLRHAERELLQRGDAVYHAPFDLYTPSDDGWPSYFKWVIPVSTLLRRGTIEGETLVAPQAIFYDNHQHSSLSHEQLFSALCRGAAEARSQEPILKFCVKSYYQGIKNLVHCGNDTTPSHPLSESGALDPHLYDARARAYRRPPQASKDLCVRRIYVGAYDDPVDLQVAITLNSSQQYFLHAMERHQSQSSAGGQALVRLYRGVYVIYDEEVRVTVAVVDKATESLDLSHYRLSCWDSVTPNGSTSSVLIPFVHGEDFSQPLHDYILRTRKNLTVARLASSASNLMEHNLGLPRLPNLMLPNAELPAGARDNPNAILRLTQHAQAIRQNLTRQYLAQSNHPTAAALLQTRYKIENYVDALQPPLIQMDECSPPVPVTFYWDSDLTNVRIQPLLNPTTGHEESAPPYYLTPLPLNNEYVNCG